MRIQPVSVALCPVLLTVALAVAPQACASQLERQVQVTSVDCERLARFEIPNVSITTAQAVAPGAFVGPPANFTGADLSAFYKKLPAFCRIVAQAKPTPDSNITVEALDATRRMEWKTRGIRQWRIRGTDRYLWIGRGNGERLRDGRHRCRPRRVSH